MPTEIVKYVDPDGGVLADYTDFQTAWDTEKAIRSDLVTRDEALRFVWQSSAGSHIGSLVSNSGDFTTDATRRIIIDGGWDGIKWDDTQPKHVSGAGTGYTIIIPVPYTLITNIQAESSANRFNGIINAGSSGTILIANSIFKATNNLTSGDIHAITGFPKIVNCIFYNFRNHSNHEAFKIGAFYAKPIVYNCTIYNCYRGMTGDYVAKNCIVQNCIDGFAPTAGAGTDYNISDLAGDAPGANSLNSTTVNFADASAGDFRLLPGSPGIDQGVDLSADPNYPFNTDIIGTLRPQGAAWDIGAFELIQQSFNPAWARRANQIIRAI